MQERGKPNKAPLCQVSRLDWPDERVQLVKVARRPHDVHARSRKDDAQLAKPARREAHQQRTPDLTVAGSDGHVTAERAQ